MKLYTTSQKLIAVLTLRYPTLKCGGVPVWCSVYHIPYSSHALTPPVATTEEAAVDAVNKCTLIEEVSWVTGDIKGILSFHHWWPQSLNDKD